MFAVIFILSALIRFLRVYAIWPKVCGPLTIRCLLSLPFQIYSPVAVKITSTLLRRISWGVGLEICARGGLGCSRLIPVGLR